jgi:hypothetical protein
MSHIDRKDAFLTTSQTSTTELGRRPKHRRRSGQRAAPSATLSATRTEVEAEARAARRLSPSGASSGRSGHLTEQLKHMAQRKHLCLLIERAVFEMKNRSNP